MDVLTKEQRHIAMSRVRHENTPGENILRKALWHRGFRYRKNYKKLPGAPDIAITKYHVAVFVDGDFWHAKGHQENPGEQVKTNREYWVKHLRNNVQRDHEVNNELAELGWIVLRFWDSDIKKNLESCVETICDYCGKNS